MNQTQHPWKSLGAEMLDRATSESRQEFNSFFLSRLFGFEVSYPK